MKNLFESEYFNKYDDKRLLKQVSHNSQRKLKHKEEYVDDQRYNDYQGAKWLNVRSKDNRTLISAFLDGLSDIDYKGYKGPRYADIKTEEDLLKAYKANKTLIDYTLNFLHKHMHGYTTVYRGFQFDDDQYTELKKKYGDKFEHQLLKGLSNKGKRFNSFSVSPFISRDFSGVDENYYKNKFHNILIAAEAEPNDISFAFTAYLLGRHKLPWEYELNINNLKDLKNLRIVTDIEKECELFKQRNSCSIKALQNKLDSGDSVKEVFDFVLNVPDRDNVYKGITPCGMVLIKDNKIVTPFIRRVLSLNSNLFLLLLVEDSKSVYKIYDINSNKISDKFLVPRNAIKSFQADDKLFPIVNIDNGNIFFMDTKTLTLVDLPINVIFSYRLPDSRDKRNSYSPWFSNEYHVITSSESKVKTIINNKGKCIFNEKPKSFDEVHTFWEELKFVTIDKKSNKIKEYEIQNGSAVLINEVEIEDKELKNEVFDAYSRTGHLLTQEEVAARIEEENRKKKYIEKITKLRSYYDIAASEREAEFPNESKESFNNYMKLITQKFEAEYAGDRRKAREIAQEIRKLNSKSDDENDTEKERIRRHEEMRRQRMERNKSNTEINEPEKSSDTQNGNICKTRDEYERKMREFEIKRRKHYFEIEHKFTQEHPEVKINSDAYKNYLAKIDKNFRERYQPRLVEDK